jgi:HD-GYP domain-containing protein (c-di-GMP phosphodiesterase class II)
MRLSESTLAERRQVLADLQRQLDLRLRKLKLLKEISLELSSEHRLPKLLELLMDRATSIVEAERSSLYLIETVTDSQNQARQRLVAHIAQQAESIVVPLDSTSITGRVACTGRTMNHKDVYRSKFFNQSFDRLHNYRTRSLLTVPMRNRARAIIGVIQAINKRNGDCFHEEDVRYLSALAAQAAIAIENSRYFSEKKELFDNLIHGQAIAVDARDHLTAGHSWRVAAYAQAIGEEMHLSEEDLEVLRYAALLHDQGKIGVPDDVLQKPGGLTDEEFAQIKSHARKTKLILNAIRHLFPKRLRPIPEMAAHHHERIDGSGYPDGLRGDEITLGARIIAVADVFDALTARRHYREPAPDDQVLALLKKEAASRKLCAKSVAAFEQALPRIIAVRTRLNQEQEKAEASGGLSGIANLQAIRPAWMEAKPGWSSVDKPPDE